MVQAAENRYRIDAPGPRDGAGQGSILLHRVSARAIVVTDISFEDAPQVSLAKHDDVVEALPADGTDQPLRVRVLPERLKCSGELPPVAQPG
jgi:hypothetical protein